MAKISIIVPVHNTQQYLRECLDSLRAQTVSDIEVICIDDGSTDDSLAILSEYAAMDHRFSVMSLPESVGPGKARNMGIDAATGEYIGFVDSDDYISSRMYEDLLSAFGISSSIDFTICGIDKFSDKSGEKFAKGEQERILSSFAGRAISWEVLGDHIFDLRFGCCNRLYRREFVLASGARFSEGIFYEDLNFHFMIFTKARKFSCLDEGHYKNRRQRQGATTFEHGGRVVGLVTALNQLDGYLSSSQSLSILEEKFTYFAYKKVREHFHKCDYQNMPVMYDYMKGIARDRIDEGNKFLGDADRDHLSVVKELSFGEYLAWDYWQAKNAVASLKRKNRSLVLKNSKARFRKDSIGGMVGSMASLTISRHKLFVWRVFRKLGLPVVIVNNGEVQAVKKVAKKPGVVEVYKRNSEKNQYDAIDFLRKREVEALNQSVVDRVRRSVRDGRRKLRVGFLVNDPTKWSAGGLLADLERTGLVECGFVCTLNHNAHKLTREGRQEEYTATRDFFQSVGPVWVDLYDAETDVTRSVEDNGCDIIFLQQPWGMMDVPRRLAGKTLCAYIHYGFVVMGNHGMHYNIAEFHSYLWKYFTQTEAHRQMHLQHDPSAHDKLEVVGYPKLDVYLRDAAPKDSVAAWKHPSDAGKKRIIFAPHHSFGAATLKMATLRWSGPEIQNLVSATEHSADWVYKPHPNLKNSVWRSKVMTESEYQMYVAAWEHGINSSVYEGGDYFDLFRSSDVLITDCGSFLAEYLPTGKPIIWLVSSGSIGLNSVGASLSESFYKVTNAEELRSVFEAVVLRGEDPLKELREEKARQVLPNDRPSGQVISDYLHGFFGLAAGDEAAVSDDVVPIAPR